MRWITVLLAALLAVVQADLWFGKANIPFLAAQRQALAQQLADNQRERVRNAAVAAEVNDLKEGLEMVEEKARSELGMLRPDEILVQVSARK